MYKREARTGVIFGLTKSEKHGILNKSSGENNRRTGTTKVGRREKKIRFLEKLKKVFQKISKTS